MRDTPWVTRKFGYEKFAVENEKGHQVAFTHSLEYACLIAAAPDLLSMLKMAQLWLDVDGRFDMQGINRAIAKAEGKA